MAALFAVAVVHRGPEAEGSLAMVAWLSDPLCRILRLPPLVWPPQIEGLGKHTPIIHMA